MRHVVPHDLPPEKLREAVRRFAEVYCERFKEYATTAEWHGEDRVDVCFKVKGIRLKGTLELLPTEIGIEMDVPFAFKLFQGRALRAIDDEVRPWIEKAQRGEI